MNEINKTDIFLEKLKEDSVKYRYLETTGYSRTEKKNMIRSLMNIRMPRTISKELLKLQDDYLQEELTTKGVVTLEDIPVIKGQPKISLWQGDITRLKVGAIVNAANSRMLGCFVPCHRCIDNAIHSAAGMQLREECNDIMNQRRIRYGRNYQEPTGTATLTKAYHLPCKYIIHTVGPIVENRLNDQLCQDLQNCYENVLKCCVENQITSIAFCCISTGEFHFPNDKAAEIAWKAVSTFLKANGEFIERVIFNVYKDIDKEQYKRVLE